MAQPYFVILGVVIIIFVFRDIYSNVLQLDDSFSPITEIITNIVWNPIRSFTFRLPKKYRHALLAFLGPLLLPFTFFVCVFILVIGFALVYLPYIHDGSFFDENMGHKFSDSLHLSSSTAMTTGYGDIAPIAPWLRVICFVEAFVGLSIISLVVAYIMTLYNALEERRIITQSYDLRSSVKAFDAGKLLLHYLNENGGPGVDELSNLLRKGKDNLCEVLEIYFNHRTIIYFHTKEVKKSTPKFLFIIMELNTVLASFLSNEQLKTHRFKSDMLLLQDTFFNTINGLLDLIRWGKLASIEDEKILQPTRIEPVSDTSIDTQKLQQQQQKQKATENNKNSTRGSKTLKNIQTKISNIKDIKEDFFKTTPRLNFQNNIKYEGENQWRQRFEEYSILFQHCEIKPERNIQEAWEIYTKGRYLWELKLFIFANYLGYDWEEISPLHL